jgi:peptidoglycan/xylan/chitin deacetylase (PgdA/CDA1 family)
VQQFKEQIAWLSEFARFCTLDEIADTHRRRSGEWRVAITIDDGYKNIPHLAFPVLEEYNAPTHWFIATSFIDSPFTLPWWDVVDELIFNQGTVTLAYNTTNLTYRLNNAGDVRRFRTHMTRALTGGVDALVDQLRNQLPANRANSQVFVTPDELTEASRREAVTVGAHTVSHPNLNCDRCDSLEELAESKRRLNTLVDQPIDWLAYPYGRTEHVPPHAESLLTRSGFRGAVTTEPGYLETSQDLTRLRRLTPQPSWDLKTFQAWVLGLPTWKLASQCRRLVRTRF